VNERKQVLFTVSALWLCTLIACGDDDSTEPESESFNDDGEWICFDYGNECYCHIARSGESPSAGIRVVENCDWLNCCVKFRDDYALRCDCKSIITDCQLETENKANASVVSQCPP